MLKMANLVGKDWSWRPLCLVSFFPGHTASKWTQLMQQAGGPFEPFLIVDVSNSMSPRGLWILHQYLCPTPTNSHPSIHPSIRPSITRKHLITAVQMLQVLSWKSVLAKLPFERHEDTWIKQSNNPLNNSRPKIVISVFASGQKDI